MTKEYLIQGDPFPSFVDQISDFLALHYQLFWGGLFLLLLSYWKKDDFLCWLRSITPPKKEVDLESTLSEQELFNRAEELRLARLKMQDELQQKASEIDLKPAKAQDDAKKLEKLRQFHPTNPKPKPPPPRREYNPLMGHGGGGNFRANRNCRPSGGG